MNWADIASIVGKAAPIAGTLLGGPAGAAIGSLVAAALGTSATPDAITAAIATDPDAALNLAQFESANKVELQRMAFAHADNQIAAQTALIQADVDDRKSARLREVDAKDSVTPRVLAAVVVASALGIGVAIVGGWVTKDASLATLLGTVIGYVFSESKQVLAYYFGSSAGSSAKTEMMAKATPAVEPNTATAP